GIIIPVMFIVPAAIYATSVNPRRSIRTNGKVHAVDAGDAVWSCCWRAFCSARSTVLINSSIIVP
ncbi:MAG: hypothetical protein ACRD4I_06620, partial [Candidatus Angelobacter sp.]